MRKCDENGCCAPLKEILVDSGRGIYKMETINIETHRTKFLGVAYKENRKSKGVMFNNCPFCGGKPGSFIVQENSND